jgi:hypothetical protein
MVSLGQLDSRMKDFFDLWLLARTQDFEGRVVAEAISHTFARVSRSPEQRPFMNGERLDTYYVGSSSGCVQARIYDKGLEVLAGGEKLWFADVWKVEQVRDVWRVEFQLRREVLKQLGIESLDDQVERAGGAWAYLTDTWLSFRQRTMRTCHGGRRICGGRPSKRLAGTSDRSLRSRKSG